MKEFFLKRLTVIKNNLYCRECTCWIYCPEMNEMHEGIERVGEGCLKHNEKGEYLECPDCGSQYYLQDE